MHDFVVRNAEICDGMGAATYVGAVALADGVISAIGTEVGRGREELDAGGRGCRAGHYRESHLL